MSLDPTSSVLSQIEYLVSSLNKKTAKSVTVELNNLVQFWGRQIEVHLLRCLLSTIDINGDTRTPLKETAQSQCLKEFFITNISKPGFTSNFCYAFDNQLKNSKLTNSNLAQFCKTLRLSRVLEVAFGLVLLHSNKNETRNGALELLKKKLPELLNNHVNPDTSRETGIYDCSVELIHHLLFSVVKISQFGVASELIESFIDTLKKDFPQVRVPVVISPFLYSDKKNITDVTLDRTTMDVPSVKTITGSLALQIQEIGYIFTTNVDTCKNHLISLGVHDITASNIAHVLAMMVRTHTGLKNGVALADAQTPWMDDKQDNDDLTTWKVDVFVQVLAGMAPMLNWSEVVSELDHPGFAVKDRQGLILLTRALLMGLRDVPFPIALMYTPWTNKDGQLFWIQQILRNPDVFCFVDYPHRIVQTGEVIKLSPEESREILTWKSLDLIEVLLSLGDIPGLQQLVNDCFRFPVQNCPELLSMGLMQASVPMSPMRQELIIGLMQLMLGGQAKDSRILVFNYALNAPIVAANQIRQFLFHAMAEWYNRNQEVYDRLTRIFQIAIKLKILLDLLNLPTYPFTIDLACLASKCDYVNLNRWLTEKIQAHGESFVQGCVLFLKRRCAVLVNPPSANDLARLPPQIPTEMQSILMCLQSIVNNVSPSLANEIMQMSNNFRAIVAHQNSSGNTSAVGTPIGGGAGPVSSLNTPGSSLLMRTTPQSQIQPPTPGFSSKFPPYGGASDSSLSSALASISAASQAPKQDFNLSIGSNLHSQQPQQQQQPPSFNPDFGGHTLFGGQPFGGHMPAVSPTASIIHSTPYNDASVRPVVATGWGAGFGVSSVSTTNPMMSAPRPISLPPPIPVGGGVGSGSGGVGVENSSLDVSVTFPDDVQEEANGYFQQIYTQPPQPSMSIEQFLDVLKRFRDAADKKQRDVFACMIKNLFEEYSFFEQYPDKELQTTALLFGGVVRENLVNNMPLMFALRVVMESLRKEPGSKLFVFGSIALEQFKMRMKEFPGYCERLLTQVPRLQQSLSPKLYEFIQHGARGELPPNVQASAPIPTTTMRSETPSSDQSPSTRFSSQLPPSLPVITTSLTQPPQTISASGTSTTPLAQLPTSVVGTPAKPAPTLNSTNIDTLVAATAKEDSKVAVPSESNVEKVAFLYNNLSQMNMQQKVGEMKTLIDDDHLPWLAQYLVMKRVSAESNFHNLYSNFVTALNNKNLNSLILKETYRNIKILLRSDKQAANFSDRTLLKNLGHWLGMITLGVSRPILHIDLDVKSLLLEAFWKGQQELLYVVPFVAKILESCQKSKVFKPPNPWTMAILNVLGELHQQPDLKLNLKFEIEVLCRHVNVEVSHLKITNILKDPNLMERSTREGQQLSNPKQLEKPTMANTLQPSPVPPASAAGMMNASLGAPVEDQGNAAPPSAVTPTPTVARFSYHDIYVNGFQGLTPHISVNAALPLFQLNPPLKNLVRPAIEHAVHELMNPVADRAIKVAMTTTENVIKKDFALDSDEGRMRLAAQNMARSLTAGMAMITCRDPLQYGIQGYLKQAFYSSLRGATTEQQRMIEEAVLAITDDNVELAQCFIVKFAAERSLVEIEKRLAPEIELRRQARMENRQFVDQQTAKFQTERMPESIRLKIGGVTQQQVSVYEEFGKNVPGFKPSTSEDLFVPFQSSANRQFWPPTSAGHGLEDEVVFQQLLRDVDARLQVAQPHTHNMHAYHGLVALRDALAMASQNPRETVTAQALVQKLVDVLLEFFVPRLFGGAPPSVAEHEWKEWSQILSDAFMAAVKNLSLIFGSQWLQKQVTKTLIDCRQDSRFNVDAVDLLIRSQLVNMVTYDLQLANSMENGTNFKAVDFAQHLVRRCFFEERSQSLNENDLSNTIEMLARITNTRMTPEGPSTLLDLVRPQATDNMFPGSFASATNRGGGGGGGGSTNMADFNAAFNTNSLVNALGAPSAGNLNQSFGQQSMLPSSANAVLNQFGVTPSASARAQAASTAPGRGPYFAQLESGVSIVREFIGDDPPGLQEKAEYLLREWVNMHHTPAAAKDPTKAFSAIVSQMHQHGILKSDDLITRFFRLCTEMCVDLCYRALLDPTSSPNVIRARCFHTLDAFVRLITLLVKHSGDGQHTTKLSLLNKVLGIIAGVLLQDHDVRRAEFHQLPFHRIFITLFLELTANDPLLEPIQMQILEAFCNTLHAVRPQRNPSFTFAWLDIIGHRAFIGRVLVANANQKAWSMYARLLIDHIQFLAPFLRNIEFQKPITLVYKGTLRILLVLLHDLPELLCDFHYALCDVIPPNCVQLRNLILSAYPRNMRLPDPFMPNLKVDQLTEINTSPRISVNFSTAIQPASVKNDLDMYLKNRAPVSFLSELRSKLQVSNEPGQKYNIPLINAVVLYVGMQAIQAIQAKEQRPSISTIAHTAHMDIFQNLAVDLDTEGRYLFFNAIANQLRYPNSHTHYFSCTLLYLFAEANSEAIQEQITRILFERLVALRPHPWGLLITFIELIKNPYYKFWTHQFVRCAPEIENLFESVARSCMAKHVNEAP